MTDTTSTTDAGLDWLAFLRVGADQHKPTFRQLLDEGLSRPAIETLFIARDAVSAGCTAVEVADFLRLSQGAYPVDVEDVFPDCPPCWCEKGLGARACLLHADYDPTDAELAVAWNGPDAHEAHRAAWALHQELHS